jgi:hypothetical protein
MIIEPGRRIHCNQAVFVALLTGTAVKTGGCAARALNNAEAPNKTLFCQD